MTTITTLSVPAIHCDNCKSSIEGAVGGLEGVHEAEVSIEEKTVAVTYDEAVVQLDGIRTAIEEQGFDVAE
jgi:copper ion binding protein